MVLLSGCPPLWSSWNWQNLISKSCCSPYRLYFHQGIRIWVSSEVHRWRISDGQRTFCDGQVCNVVKHWESYVYNLRMVLSMVPLYILGGISSHSSHLTKDEITKEKSLEYCGYADIYFEMVFNNWLNCILVNIPFPLMLGNVCIVCLQRACSINYFYGWDW